MGEADALTPAQLKQQLGRLKRASKTTPLILSAATGRGVTEALRAMADAIQRTQAKAQIQA